MKSRYEALWTLVVLLIMACAAQPAVAGGSRDHRVSVVDLRGDVVAGGQLRLYIQPGPAATRSLRIFSEPSHTLLAVVIDSGFAREPQGKALLEEQKGAAVAVTDLPEGQPALQVPGRPPGDDRVAVYVVGESGEEQLAADARVGAGPFHFSTAFVNGGPKAGGGMLQCCHGGPCGEMCAECGPKFTCCLTDDCCKIFCGWAGTCCQHK